MAASRRMQIKPFLSPYLKLNSKMIRNLNIKPDTLILIEEKVGHNLELKGTGKNFLNKTLFATGTKTNNSLGPHETEKLLHGKGYCHSEFYKLEKLFTSYTSNRELSSRIYKYPRTCLMDGKNTCRQKTAYIINK